MRHLRQLDRTDLFADEHGLRRVLDLARAVALQVHQDAPTEVAHVRCALTQVDVLHVFEHLGMRIDALTQRRRGPVSLFDQLDGLGDQGVAAKHQQQGIEQRDVLFRYLTAQACLERTQVVFNRVDSVTKRLAFGIDIFGLTIRHGPIDTPVLPARPSR